MKYVLRRHKRFIKSIATEFLKKRLYGQKLASFESPRAYVSLYTTYE